jgi:hypothetical protein
MAACQEGYDAMHMCFPGELGSYASSHSVKLTFTAVLGEPGERRFGASIAVRWARQPRLRPAWAVKPPGSFSGFLPLCWHRRESISAISTGPLGAETAETARRRSNGGRQGRTARLLPAKVPRGYARPAARSRATRQARPSNQQKGGTRCRHLGLMVATNVPQDLGRTSA